jgi:hypothetical protein
MQIEQMTDAELYALMNEAYGQLELAEGMEAITRAPQLKARMRQQVAKARAGFNALMAEYDRRSPRFPDTSADELRSELQGIA